MRMISWLHAKQSGPNRAFNRRAFHRLVIGGAALALPAASPTTFAAEEIEGRDAYGVPKEHMPNPYGPHCADQEVRMASFRESCHTAFARNDFVGWCWCGWLDLWDDSYPDKQHAGLQDVFGQWDQPIQRAMKHFSDNLYTIASQ